MTADLISLLHKVFQGGTLSQAESQAFFTAVVKGEVNDIILTSMLTALKMRGETPEEIAGAAAALIENAAPIPRPDYPFADIVGTGGDGQNTINVSSAAAIVAASCGVHVAKHGNRSVSSKSGAADLFWEYGLNLTMPADVARRCLDESNFCFLYAPNYHAGIQHAMKVRTALKTRTIFNLLGPLVNPAHPTHIITGVYLPELIEPYAKTLQLLGYKHAMVVHGSGLDEISLHGDTEVAEVDGDEIKYYRLTAKDFGLSSHPLDAIRGGEPAENKAMIGDVLQGRGIKAHRDSIAANAGALLKLCGKAETFAEGAQMALDSLAQGKPYETIKQCAELSQQPPSANNQWIPKVNTLEKIVIDKRLELIGMKEKLPLEEVKKNLTPSEKSLYCALAEPHAGFILECKKASPSKGLIRENFDLDEILAAYTPHASAISVLTDEKYFQGSFDYLKYVTDRVKQPVLNKDIFIDPYQVYLARYYNADAILLMLSVLTDEEYVEMAEIAKGLNLDVLTEVSNVAEAQRALKLGANMIGINNRNLRDLSTDLATTEQLAPLLSTPEHADCLLISESGIYTNQDVRRLSPLVDGFLVGSSLMAQKDLPQAVTELIHGKVKVCGITREQDALTAKAKGATYLGLIFADISKRKIDLATAQAITQACPHRYVGVFVDADISLIVDHAKALNLVAVQLHGNEDQEYIIRLRNALPMNCEIWKAKGVTDKLPAMDETDVDYFLLDCQTDDQSGGTGKSFDWRLLDTLADKSNLILAGGLRPSNIATAAASGVACIDINSGVESAPGIKDEELLSSAFSALREY